MANGGIFVLIVVSLRQLLGWHSVPSQREPFLKRWQAKQREIALSLSLDHVQKFTSLWIPEKSRSLLTRQRGRRRQWRWSGWGCGRRPPGAGTSPGTRGSLRWVDKSETHLCRLGVWRHGRLLWVFYYHPHQTFFFVAKLLETVEFMLKNYGMLFRCLIMILREKFITCNSGSWVGRWPFSSLSGLPFLVWSRISTKSFLYVGKLTTLYPFLGMATKAFHLRILQC